MTEEHPFNNRNFYGATKIAGEAMCTAYNDRYGLPIVGLRYMNVFGPGQDQHAAYTGVIPIMLNKIEANEAPLINGDGSQAYDFIYVEDVARCNVLAAASGVSTRLLQRRHRRADDDPSALRPDSAVEAVAAAGGLQAVLGRRRAAVREEPDRFDAKGRAGPRLPSHLFAAGRAAEADRLAHRLGHRQGAPSPSD